MDEEIRDEISEKVDKLLDEVRIALCPLVYKAMEDYIALLESLPEPKGIDKTPNKWWKPTIKSVTRGLFH